MKQIAIDINGVPYQFDSGADTRPLKTREVIAQKLFPHSSEYQPKYKVMVSPNGELFNPCDPEMSLKKRARQYGLNTYYYNLRKCSEDCFNDYVAFLRSKNKTNLILAQRRFRDES